MTLRFSPHLARGQAGGTPTLPEIIPLCRIQSLPARGATGRKGFFGGIVIGDSRRELDKS
jgi:hypothetical protein